MLFIIFYTYGFAQWQLVLMLKSNEFIADVSAATDNIIWTITNNFIIYNTNNGDTGWNKIKPKGLADNISVLQLYAVTATTAFLSVNTNFTGVGPNKPKS